MPLHQDPTRFPDGERRAAAWLLGLGAAGVLASLYGKFNLSVLLLMAVWIVITIYGLVRTFRGEGPAQRPIA